MTAGLKKIFAGRGAWGRAALAVAVIISFMAGYNAMSVQSNYCMAQATAVVPPAPPFPIVGGACTCCKGCAMPCEPVGTAAAAYGTIYSAFSTTLRAQTLAMEVYLASNVDWMVQSVLERLNVIEINMIHWWRTRWTYEHFPMMKEQTTQLNTVMVDRSRTFQSASDADIATKISLSGNKAHIETQEEVKGDVCETATASGGIARASAFSREMRRALQKENTDSGLNRTGSPGAKGLYDMAAHKAKNFRDYYCDPSDLALPGGCSRRDADVPQRANAANADIRITRNLFNNKTIQIDDPDGTSERHLPPDVVKDMIDNITGTAAANPIPPTSVNSSQARELLVKRRSWLARHNAVRSVPQLIAGWRVPGANPPSFFGENSPSNYALQMRNAAGFTQNANEEGGENFSYREMMHTLAFQRFNSGSYAIDSNKGEKAVELEKLANSTLYLMQLRDYHDLMERVALTLAVQTAMLAEEVPLPQLRRTHTD